MKDISQAILYGGDYNPDQWDEGTLCRDMELLVAAGVNTVSLPVFSWAKLEPEEGIYAFGWLDKILDMLWEHGIYVFLATPTSAQPAWLSKKYPDVLPVDIQGRKRTHGMRVFFCVNSKTYRKRAAAIAKAMAERYKSFPGLIGWHVANEYGTYCYCETCQIKFRKWLKTKYHSLENINEKWNTAFWGRTLADFDEIMLPTELNDDYRFNPVIQLDYLRFVTDSTIECFNNEAKIIKGITPHLPVFTNISGYIKKIDQFKMIPHMDFAGWDNYPWPTDERSFPAMKHDLMRAAKEGQSYCVMEQSPNQQNWQPYNKIKRPGEVRKIAYQGLAHGSDSSLFFQMRQSIGGQEKYHGAFISHCGHGDTRIYKEVQALGQELKKCEGTFRGGTTSSEVGVLFDWETWWSLELASGPTKDMDYLEQVHYYYKAFYKKNISVDMVKTTLDLSGYKVIVAPLMYMVDEALATKLGAFVQAGGILIATYMTGYVDAFDRCLYGAYPGLLKQILGMWVEEVDALRPEEENGIQWQHLAIDDKKNLCKCGFICDLVRLDTAKALAVYTKDFYAGMPAVTVNSYGKGEGYYIGTQIEEAGLEKLVAHICQKVDLHPPFLSQGDLEIRLRENATGIYVFVINFDNKKGWIDLGENMYRNMLDGEVYCGCVEIESNDVMVFCQCLVENSDDIPI